jgi:3-oxoadipate enol-lactonase
VSVLVLANALGTSVELWAPQLPRLEPRFEVLRFPHRGRDSVDALGADVLDRLDEAGVDRVSFCGLSLGGAVGMWVAANAPERIARLVLACTSARFGSPEAWHERAALVRASGTEAVVELTLGRWFTPGFRDTEPYRQMLLDTPREDYAAQCEALATWDFRDRLGEIAAPTLVLAAAEDPSTPAEEHGRVLAEGIAGARLVVLPGAAHLANVEQPEAFADAVLEHLIRAPQEVA